VVSKKTVCGITLANNKKILSKIVILTTGTYMKSLTHIGDDSKNEGPRHLQRSETLSSDLHKLGFQLLRLKTGTPPRVDKNTINYQIIKKELGTDDKLCFSHFNKKFIKLADQLPCFLTFTNKKTHQLITKNINKSATYSGKIKGVGPLYCPSIEDKVVRFKDRDRHQLFIEPESLSLNTMYIQGLSNAFPKDIQQNLVHSIKGLEKAKISEYAYAIEYDAINPIQLKPSLESKKIKNLYFAGQVNGTSGYEEAACQGLMAGINASLQLQKKKPLIIKRSEGYIGVLIDDLVTKGVTDPYRLLTSRAEYRLSLRNDNADDRLSKYGFKIGLIKKQQYQSFLNKAKLITKIIKYLHTHSLSKTLQKQFDSSTHTLYSLLKRTDVALKDVLPKTLLQELDTEIIKKIEIQVKFDGYIKNQEKYIDRFNKYESFSLEKIIDYRKIKNLSLEAIDKLNKIKPLSLGQAQRISGINLTDLFIIKHYIDKITKHE
jgi:tRNA uridine 5-carboxymethylaminomethyl modification enzyme